MRSSRLPSRPAAYVLAFVACCSDSSAPAPSLAECPAGMVLHEDDNLQAPFCMGALEESSAEFAAFAEAGDAISDTLPAGCSAEQIASSLDQIRELSEFAPSPVMGYTDWCVAHSYCAYQGKRLCGAIGGDQLDLNDFDDPTLSEWHWACSNGGTTAFPYGDSLDKEACSYEHGGDIPASGSFPSCTSERGVLDLSGNAWEWTNECELTEREGIVYRSCRARGGGLERGPSDSDSYFACTAESAALLDADLPADVILDWMVMGMRCCADPTVAD